MIITVDLPAAWCMLPLDLPNVTNPDLHDDPPRYTSEPEGGWTEIGNAVAAIYGQIQEQLDDPFQLQIDVSFEGALSQEQERIVGTWFSETEAPQCGPRDDAWTNGRHRSWGLKSAGFRVAPILLIPLGDAVHFWYPDPMGWPPLDHESIANQREELAWWSFSPSAEPWRSANPGYEDRWSEVLDRWTGRLNPASE